MFNINLSSSVFIVGHVLMTLMHNYFANDLPCIKDTKDYIYIVLDFSEHSLI